MAYPELAGRLNANSCVGISLVLYILLHFRCHMALYTHVLFLYLMLPLNATPSMHMAYSKATRV